MLALKSATICLALVSVNAGLGEHAEPPGTGLHVGTAIVDITPPIGYRLSGYFYERPSTGIHDPLHARAVVFSQGDKHAVIVVCDLIGVPAPVANEVRQQAGWKTGITPSNIVISATHTHTGPLYFGALRKYLHEAAVARDGVDEREALDYPKALKDKLVDAIIKAHDLVRPVSIQVGTARQDPPISFHRRFYMADGTVRFNPGWLNPDIVRPCGPIDPQVTVLMMHEPGSHGPFASFTVFANHLDTTGGTEYSADYPYYLGQHLKMEFGEGHLAIFGQGTCGNINHFDVTKPREQGKRSPREIGTLLAETVLSTLPESSTVTSASLAVRSRTIAVPAQRYSEDQVREAREAMLWYTREERSTGQGEKTPKPSLSKVEACKIVDLDERWGSTIPLEVQVVRISREVAIVALPGEVFVELGLAIKEASPFKTTIVMELCNSYPHYIPTRKGFAEGSYEAVNSRVEPGSGEKMVEVAVELLKSLADSSSDSSTAPEKVNPSVAQ